MVTDAPWTLRVTNVSKGWTFETYAGKSDTPKLDAAHPIVLQQPFKGSWSWSDYPIGWTPRQAQLSLRCYSAAAFEAIGGADQGDLVDVWLFHEWDMPHVPLPVHRTDTWHRVVGYLDDPEATADDRGLVIDLAAVDPLARLAEVIVDDPTPWPQESLGARLQRIASAAGINIVSKAAYAALATMGPVTVNNKGALPLLQECLAGVQAAGGGQLVLRGTVGEIEETGLGDQINFDQTYQGSVPVWQVDPVTFATQLLPGKPAYWIDEVKRTQTMNSPFVLTAAHDLGAPGAAPGVGLYVAQRTARANLWDVGGGAALSAGQVLRDQTKWTKSHATAINQVKLVGVDAAGAEKSVVAQYADLVKRDGPSTRVVQTQRLIDAGAPAVAAALLPDPATATPEWTANQFTFTTRGLPLAALHAYSSRLYPKGSGNFQGGMQLPVAIVGVDLRRSITGGDLSGILEGAALSMDARGRLTIVGQLRNEVLRPSGLKTDLVTYADLRAETASNDPTLAWSTFAYHSDDAVPSQGSDRTWDASQAHPMFGHEQLTYRDLRLIGVD